MKYVLTEWNTNRPRLDPNGSLFPIFENRIKMEIEKRELIIEEQENKKIEWKGTKGEFGRFVAEEHAANRELYTSLRNASDVLFDKHKFKWKDWTKEQCYDLAKKS